MINVNFHARNYSWVQRKRKPENLQKKNNPFKKKAHLAKTGEDYF